ncbi:xylosyltransferase oxt [Hetaerina americana]|uniref:xylosyltransferase oxt n=1 Tax=Hetaerina americana TaxID=62018 RepID=UPI003A7F52AC
MAASRTLDSRWIRRYRVFFLLGSIILGFQVFLAFKFFPIDAGDDERAQEHRDVSGRGKINIEVLNEIVNNAGGVSARRFKESYLVDDEDGPANSNPDNGGPLRKIKVPPDKLEEDGIPQGSMKQGNAIAPVKGQAILATQRAQSSPNKTGTGLVVTLRLEELDFTPECEIVGREAVSAIHRARTQSCKKLLADVACRSHAGTLYPTKLPHLCPAPGLEGGRSLGCFQDEKTFRLLSGYYANLKATNSPAHCINLCLQSGFPYAGVQYSSECFCGSDEPPSPARLPDSSCNMKCPADPKLACGGFFTINVYQTGIAKFVPQTPREAPVPTPPHLPDGVTAPHTIGKTGEEAPVRIAFLLTLNGRALRQVRRLLKALFHTRHFFFIHVDARQDYLFRELLPLERMKLLEHPWGNITNSSNTYGSPNPFSNIRLSRKRFSTIWGGASLLRTLLESMRQLLVSPWPWDYVVNLSESDFPVKTDAQLVSFLTANRGKSFVKSHGRDAQRFVQKQGLDKTFVECDLHMWRAGERQLPEGIAVDGGSDWVALARPFVEYVASGGDDPNSPLGDTLVHGLKALFRHTLLPAESFFHTALRNSKHCGMYVDNNLHVTNWRRRLGCRCQYRHVVDWCGCSPNDFRMDDWPRLQGTEDKQLYFARKFEPIVSQAIIDRVETWLYGPHPSDIVSIDSYWQNIFHHADLSPAADDTILTVAHSAARLGADTIFANSSGNAKKLEVGQCKLTPTKILEVTSYHHDDNYQGSLILYEASIPDGSKVVIETWIVPQHHVSFYPKSSADGKGDPNQLASKFKMLWISSDFDQKEQMSRNHIGALGPFSEPALAYQLVGKTTKPGRPVQHHNVTFAWFDSAGQLAELSQVSLEEGGLSNTPAAHSPSSSPPSSSYSSPAASSGSLAGMMGVVKPSLRQPIRPGIWRVLMIEDGASEPTAMLKFLITPLQFVSGVGVSQQQAGFLHNGPGQGYEAFPADFERFASWTAPGESEKEGGGARLRRSIVNSRRFGHDLHGWIDSLTSKFYSIHESCLAAGFKVSLSADVDAQCKGIKLLKSCTSTKWSSLYPDPKSEIRGVHFTSGRMNRW